MERSVQEQCLFRVHRRAVVLVIAVSIACVIGCDKEPTHSPQLSDDDYLAFAKLMEKAARAGDVAAINQVIDWDAIVTRAMTPSAGSDEFDARFLSATKRDLVSTYGIALAITELMKQGGEFRCLRIHMVDGAKRALFRLLLPRKPSLDYFEFELARRGDGVVRATDCYTFRTGDMISEAVRRYYRWIAPAGSKSMARRTLTAQEIDVLDNDRKIRDMEAYSHAGDGRRALEIYAQLSAGIRNEKGVLLTRLEAANFLHGKAYDEAMQAIRSALPGDRCLDFVLVDYYVAHQRYDDLQAAIDRLDRRLGGDPQQEARRALGYMLQKKYQLAREHAKTAIASEQTLLLPYCVLLQSALEEKSFDEVRRLLTVMEEKSLTEFPDLATVPAYAEFVKSPEYQTWLNDGKNAGHH
jgi:tetratricopeptide (TPR) repeat protein